MIHQQMPLQARSNQAPGTRRVPDPLPAGLGGFPAYPAAAGPYVPPGGPPGPHVGWVVLSWVLCVVLTVGGLIGGAFTLVTAMETAAPAQAFTSGQWVEVAGPGRYQLTCDGAGVQFGVGTRPAVAGLLGGIAIAFGGGLIGLAGASITTISVVTRRRAR